MRKHLLFTVLTVSVISLFFIFLSQRSNDFDHLLLNENVEALSQEESGNGCTGTKDAMSRVIGYGFYNTSDASFNVEVTVAGNTAKVGGTNKKRKNIIPFAVYDCVPEKDQCCTKQGMYSGEDKLA